MVLALTSAEEKLTRTLVSGLQVRINGLAGLLGDLELHGTAGLPLTHCGAFERVAVRRDIVDLEAHHITSAQLAVDRQIEQG